MVALRDLGGLSAKKFRGSGKGIHPSKSLQKEIGVSPGMVEGGKKRDEVRFEILSSLILEFCDLKCPLVTTEWDRRS